MSDLATSMVIARAGRGKVSTMAMINTTLHVWRQPGRIAAFRVEQAAASRYRVYDEHYIENPLLGRLVETKFYDTAFHFSQTLTSQSAKARLRRISIDFIWASLPRPVLQFLGIGVDKDNLNFSMGDYLAYLSRGVPLGGRITGNLFAQGIPLFGPLFPFLYAFICLALYALMDLLTIRSESGKVTISAFGMLQVWTYFMSGITYESLNKVLMLFIRSFEQMLLIYVFIFALARGLIPKKAASINAIDLATWPARQLDGRARR
jgi:hypothetical protein